MTNLKLFRVTVIQEWSSEGEALVWAENSAEAETAASAEVDLDLLDAECVGMYARAKPEPLSTLEQLDETEASSLWLIAPLKGRPGVSEEVRLEEFLSMITPEQIEAARIARIEANNGQLMLLPYE